MESLRISAKFLGIEVEFNVDNPSTYTLATLCADVYMYGCSTFPEPTESFKVEALIPWRGIFRVIADDDDLQDLFAQYKSKHIRTIRLDVELLPLAWSPPDEFYGQESPPADSDQSSTQPKTAANNATDGFVEISSDEHSVSEGGTNNVSTSSNEDSDFLPRSSDEDTETESDIGRQSFEFVQEDMFGEGFLYGEEDGAEEGHINEEEQQPEAETAHGDAPQQPDGETAQGDYEQQQTEGNAADGDDEQQQTDSGSESEEDVLSDAASFQFNQDFTVLSSSDDEVGIVRRPYRRTRGKPFNQAPDGKVELEVGQLFHSLQHFRQVLRDFVVQEGFELKRIKNARERFTAKCGVAGCSWRIHASRVDSRSTFMIKTLTNRHCCMKVHKNQEANAVWVARRFKALIEENPEISIQFLGKEIHRIYGLTLPKYTLYRAKNRVLNVTDDEHHRSYNKLYSYGFVVRKCNPGSIAFLRTVTPEINAPARFQRFFLSFEAQKLGFLQGCRPIIGLDGCHLKGRFPGVLLAAVGLDANNGVFPIAICIAEGETKDSWCWFMEQLHMHIGLEETRRVTFITDRQKGVLSAIERHWSTSSNHYCVRHLIANMQMRYKGQLTANYTWEAANASNRLSFMECMAKLKEVHADAHDYMMGINLHNWCVHLFDRHVKSEHTTNNITEGFNSWIDKYRGLPALLMLECLRRKMMKRMHLRLERASKWESVIPPKIRKKIADRQDEARFVTVLCASVNEFEVKDGSRYFIVKLDKNSCDCGLWEVSGIPCKHALAVIIGKRLHVEDYVVQYLTRDAYVRTYSHVIHPIPSEDQWPESTEGVVMPPQKRRLPGRPKKSRKRAADEPQKQKRSSSGKCSKCGEYGHNVRTCKVTEKATKTNITKKTVQSRGTRTSKKRLNFEVGSSSKAPMKKTAMDSTAEGVGSSQPVQQTVIDVGSSQPVTETAPLHSSQVPTQQAQSKSNPGTVAGLDIDWSGML
ncbi:hypothetical protein ACOSP7_031013 [Xanthoceras sorbifolium]